jgi:S1-C subfamily serine protease
VQGKWFAQSVVLGAIVAGSMVLGGFLAVSLAADDAPAGTPVTSGSGLVTSGSASPGGSSVPVSSTIDDLPGLVERVMPSVVQVSASAGVLGGEGVGTGIVVDTDGHILTNYHVVEGAREVEVTFADESTAVATVVGTDPSSDLAVLRADVESSRLTPAVLGDSDAVRLGEPVFAIGNPFGLSFTVTSGIVSAVARERPALDGRPIRNVIQTDAAVNPGNSGGPLFNDRGEVVGINTSIENPTGQRVFVGIGFAVPSNTASRYLPQLLRGETPRHAQLGISGVTLDATTAASLGIDETSGVYITGVSAGSPAAQAGLRAGGTTAGGVAGDVVTAIDGRAVRSISELAGIIDSRSVGDSVTLTVQRNGQQVELRATLREWQTS